MKSRKYKKKIKKATPAEEREWRREEVEWCRKQVSMHMAVFLRKTTTGWEATAWLPSNSPTFNRWRREYAQKIAKGDIRVATGEEARAIMKEKLREAERAR